MLFLRKEIGILFKCFSRSGAAEYAGDMMLFSSFTMFAVYTAASRISAIRAGEPRLPRTLPSRFFCLIALGSGLLGCLYDRLNISLSGKFPAAVFYPCFNGGVILFSTLLSILLLRERPTRKQLVGLAIGIAAVVVVGVF